MSCTRRRDRAKAEFSVVCNTLLDAVFVIHKVPFSKAKHIIIQHFVFCSISVEY